MIISGVEIENTSEPMILFVDIMSDLIYFPDFIKFGVHIHVSFSHQCHHPDLYIYEKHLYYDIIIES